MPDPVLLDAGEVTFTAYPGTTIHIVTQDPPPPPPPPPPPVDPNAMPVGDLPGWRQIFTEDFLTPVPLGKFPDAQYSTKFTAYKDWWTDTTGHGTYMPSRVLSVHDSVLDMYIHTEYVPDPLTKLAKPVHMVSTVCPILNPGAPQTGQLYHRHAIRFRVLDPIAGYKGVPLLWPDPKQPQKKWSPLGEIDFPEAAFNKKIHAYTHYANGTAPNDQQAFSTNVPMAGAWHICETVWQPDSITYLLDGVQVGQTTTRIPNVPFHLDVQFETATDEPAPNNTDSTHVEIDWLVIYSWAPDLPPVVA